MLAAVITAEALERIKLICPVTAVTDAEVYTLMLMVVVAVPQVRAVMGVVLQK